MLSNADMIQFYIFIVVATCFAHDVWADWSEGFVEERMINYESERNENRHKIMAETVGDSVTHAKSFCILTGLSQLAALKDPYREKIERCIEESGEPSAAVNCSDQEESAVKDMMEDIVLEATSCVKQS